MNIETENTAVALTFAEGELAENVYARYTRELKQNFEGIGALQRLSLQKNRLEGVNPYNAVLVNSLANSLGYQLASQAELEANIRGGKYLIGTREFTGLISRPNIESKPESHVAKSLRNQFFHHPNFAGRGNSDESVFILLRDLDLIRDDSGEEGLSFKLKENASLYFGSKLLNKTGNFCSQDVDLITGLPYRVGKGDRTFYSSLDPLSSVCLSWSLSVNADGHGLIPSKDYDQYSRRALVRLK